MARHSKMKINKFELFLKTVARGSTYLFNFILYFYTYKWNTHVPI